MIKSDFLLSDFGGMINLSMRLKFEYSTAKHLCMFIFLFIAYLLYFFQPVNVFAHESARENTIIIHVDKYGFDPSKVILKNRTEVVFENVGREEHWPASDDHPSHTLYDGTNLAEHCAPGATSSFDACKSILSDKSWAFVFEEEGIYKFHDHLWPHLGGEIIVKSLENENHETKNIFSRILDYLQKVFFTVSNLFTNHEKNIVLNSGNVENELYRNLKDQFKKLVLQSDPREAIHMLEEKSSQNDKVSALCHDILHEIGHTAYSKYGNFKEAAKYQDDFCNSGYIHGLFESYFKSTDDPLSVLSDQCSDYASGRRQFDLWQCRHGIGHGLMYLTGGDLDETLELCERGLGRDAAVSCQNGVYMELFNLELLAKEKGFVDPENPWLTCSTRAAAKGDCYLYMPTYLSQTLGMDFADIFKECDKAEFGYRGSCIRGIGSEAIKRNMNSVSEVFALCRQAGSDTDQETCVAGAVGMYMNQDGSYSAGEKLCELAPKQYQVACSNALKERKNFFITPPNST